MVTNRGKPFRQAEMVRDVSGKEPPNPETQPVVGFEQGERQLERVTRRRRVIAEQQGHWDDQPRTEPA